MFHNLREVGAELRVTILTLAYLMYKKRPIIHSELKFVHNEACVEDIQCGEATRLWCKIAVVSVTSALIPSESDNPRSPPVYHLSQLRPVSPQT